MKLLHLKEDIRQNLNPFSNTARHVMSELNRYLITKRPKTEDILITTINGFEYPLYKAFEAQGYPERLDDFVNWLKDRKVKSKFFVQSSKQAKGRVAYVKRETKKRIFRKLLKTNTLFSIMYSENITNILDAIQSNESNVLDIGLFSFVDTIDSYAHEIQHLFQIYSETAIMSIDETLKPILDEIFETQELIKISKEKFMYFSIPAELEANLITQIRSYCQDHMNNYREMRLADYIFEASTAYAVALIILTTEVSSINETYITYLENMAQNFKKANKAIFETYLPIAEQYDSILYERLLREYTGK